MRPQVKEPGLREDTNPMVQGAQQTQPAQTPSPTHKVPKLPRVMETALEILPKNQT